MSRTTSYAKSLDQAKEMGFDLSAHLNNIVAIEARYDPSIERQIASKSLDQEPQQHEATQDRKTMVEQEQAAPKPQPPEEIRRAVDDKIFNDRWSAEIGNGKQDNDKDMDFDR